MDFSLTKKEGIDILELSDAIDTGTINLIFTCKSGGISVSPFNSLNMGNHVGDKEVHVMENRRKILEMYGYHIEDAISSQQIHGDYITVVNVKDKGRGMKKIPPIPNSDGLITTNQDIVLMSFYADCVPLYLWDCKTGVVGLAHAGWKGTCLDIAGKMVENFLNRFHSNIKDIKAAIGPSICKSCYEVDDTVIQEFRKTFQENELHQICTDNVNGRFHLDLWKANEILLQRCGILPGHIIVSRYCTYCNPHLFYSYRRDQGKTGRMASLIFKTNRKR
ncbi:hypothetical protein BHU72_07745 [Desulfuribacillus stibiiarsenatis]|uniref:Purine nucleoside phosphorylase n=1 Tax=Desulfuribacillus stibiiarsenatis TaxID=1390249 RepID=A0A1E5L3K1_9FIRM|nr:peptidoglycan editing factor PgeF [Desulfuribacillus stibiiarsenatis]OEH84720.1 hypothetical protein BHU72_07745 [Desulfuribacillus stibiiarsenatis]